MILKYRVSIYGRVVYFLKGLLYLLILGGMFGFGINPGPYNDPGLFVRIFLTILGGCGILLGISCIAQTLKFRPRICISDNGIKYNGFYLHTFINWEEIHSVCISTVGGGFTVLDVTLNKRRWGVCKALRLDLSGLTPGHEEIDKQIYRRLVKRRNDI